MFFEAGSLHQKSSGSDGMNKESLEPLLQFFNNKCEGSTWLLFFGNTKRMTMQISASNWHL